jgi:hypothetical protein
MKTESKIAFLCVFLGILILVSCSNATQTSIPSPTATASTSLSEVIPLPQSGECIPPYTNLAFPEGGGEIDKQPKAQIPPTDWEFISDVPNTTGHLTLHDFAASNDDIWVSYIQSDTKGNKSVLARYNISEKGWKFYLPPGNTYGSPHYLFVSATTGELWGYYSFFSTDKLENGLSLFVHYNIANDQFEPVTDKQGFLQTPRTINGKVAEDKNGLLWMFIKENPGDSNPTLYSFNPKSLQAEKHDIHSKSFSVFPRADGNLWISDWVEHKLALYDPHSRKTQYFDSIRTFTTSEGQTNIPFTEVIGENIGPSYFDNSGRLWFSYSGWLDLNNLEDINWYGVITPPEFVVYAEPIQPMFILSPATLQSIYQSSNGWMWFSTIDGIIRLKIVDDFRYGEWCKVTNGQSKVVEDQRDNLWMIVFNKIYKYKLPR